MTRQEYQTIRAVFTERRQAEQAVVELRKAGVDESDYQLEDSAEIGGVKDGISGVLLTVRTSADREQMQSLLRHHGAHHVQVLRHLDDEDPGVAQEEGESSVIYDPIRGRIAEKEQMPADTGGYGLKRDPRVETDATAQPRTYDREVRPDSEVDTGMQRSIFDRPLEETKEEPGSSADPNIRLPRVP